MRVAVSYPPIVNELGQVAMVSQNRNVQFFKKPTYLLPVIHPRPRHGCASSATTFAGTTGMRSERATSSGSAILWPGGPS
jgi:hypothetical protein